MPTFQKCDKSVRDMAESLLKEFESHKPLIDAKVNVDFVFAFCDRDDDGQPMNDALMLHGVKALGVARKLGLKDRAMGRGDAEICLDGDYWGEKATDAQQRALLDHELHHLAVKTTKGQFVYDALGRPVIRMRKHDFQVGWFKCIADRHGKHSQEQIQAAYALDAMGQSFWPQLGAAIPKAISKGK